MLITYMIFGEMEAQDAQDWICQSIQINFVALHHLTLVLKTGLERIALKEKEKLHQCKLAAHTGM